jgi:hypothetical protein
MREANAATPRIDDFLVITEVDRGTPFAEPIFQRKYRTSAPDFPYHVVSFWKRDDGAFVPVSYVHFWHRGRMMLIGGACTDGNVVRQMSEAQRRAIDAAGGINLLATRYALRRYGPMCDVVFGHCGDPRSFAILMRCGFQPAKAPYLIAYWPRLLDAEQREALIAEADALGPF